jgi:hypothetical protein
MNSTHNYPNLNTTNERKVPPITIKKTKIRASSENEDLQSSPNSDNDFRSPRRTSKVRDTSTKKSYTTPNRYSILDNPEIFTYDNIATLDAPNVNQNIDTPQSQTTVNTPPKIPPLFVINISEFTQFRKTISEVIQNEFSITAKVNNIKINVQTIGDFRSLTKLLDEKNYEYYTYRLKEEKDISAIIRNLPMSITTSEVTEELKNLNYPVQSVIRLTNKDKAPTPLLAIQLLNNPRGQEIFKLNKLLNCIIIIEPRRMSKDPPQCTNCQRYGHIHKSCKLQPRCVKCNGQHHYSKCEKTQITPPNCVNCNGAHPANYKGCTYFKNIINKKTNKIQKYLPPPTESENIINSTKNENTNIPTKKLPNRTSYADIIKSKSNPINTAQNNADNISTEYLNENLQKTISQFIENILRNIQTIISSIFHSITNNLSIPTNNVNN